MQNDDALAAVDGEIQMRHIANIYGNADHTRILKALGFESNLVTSYSLGCVGPGRDLLLTVTRYITNGELRALAEELEANPPTKKE